MLAKKLSDEAFNTLSHCFIVSLLHRSWCSALLADTSINSLHLQVNGTCTDETDTARMFIFWPGSEEYKQCKEELERKATFRLC
jgi:hypothetical protein